MDRDTVPSPRPATDPSRHGGEKSPTPAGTRESRPTANWGEPQPTLAPGPADPSVQRHLPPEEPGANRRKTRETVDLAAKLQAAGGDLAQMREVLLEGARTDPSTVFAVLEGLPLSDRLKIDIGGEMLGIWTAAAARDAAAWAVQNRWTNQMAGPVVKVAEEWARLEPAAALDWAASLAPGLDQIGALIAATARWSKTDFSAVADYVDRQPGGLPRDVMAGTLAREFGQEDPAAGLQWALAVGDPVGRERAAAGAITDLHRTNPARAALLLQAAGLTPDQRQSVEKRVAGPLPWWH